MQSSTPYPPEDPGAEKRRSRFGGRTGQAYAGEATIEEALADYQRALEQRLDQGLLAIQDAARRLMKEIAAEMWRTAKGNMAESQDRILAFVTRDQTVRSVLAHSDERFQALAMRTERLEEVLRHVAESGESMKELIARSAEALTEAARSPAIESIDAVRRQLEQVAQRIDATMGFVAERDRAIVETVESKVSENGAMVAGETGRVVEAMQTYVQGGVDTMGRLAQRVEEHMAAKTESDQAFSERITEQLTSTLGEQISMLYERLGMEGRSLADSISSHEEWLRNTIQETDLRTGTLLRQQAETIRESARLAAGEVNRVLDERVVGLARLVRSDSEALRTRLVETTAAQDEAIARVLDERLTRVSEAVDTATRWTVQETTHRVGEVTDQAIEGRMEQVTLALDRNLIHIKDALDLKLSRIGPETAEAADRAVGQRMDEGAERLAASVDAIDQARMSFERMQAEAEESVTRNLDQRIGALAKMIRSDNRALADRVDAAAADQDSAKQTLRAIKELQANLGSEVVSQVERRLSGLSDQLHRDTQSMAESFAKSADVLSRKIDRIASQTEQQVPAGEDVQVAIERMGEAMHALATIGSRHGPPPEDRIDLE
jgi:hypothetical protein